jgi:hypothetical protein
MVQMKPKPINPSFKPIHPRHALTNSGLPLVTRRSNGCGVVGRRWIPLLLSLLIMTGCSLTTEERAVREKGLKQVADQFIGAVIAGDFRAAYGLSTGRLGSAAALEKHLKQPWNTSVTLSSGTVASMAWVGDNAAKVKVVWTFLDGVQQSHSAETTIWIWNDGKWRYEGRSLR